MQYREIFNFINKEEINDVTIRKEMSKIGHWRVGIIKHNKTGLFILRCGRSGYNPTELRYYIKHNRFFMGLINEIYQEGETFSVLEIKCENEEAAENLCYDLTEKFKLNKKFTLPKTSSYYFKDFPQEFVDVIDGCLAGDGGISRISYKKAMFVYTICEKQKDQVYELYDFLKKYDYPKKVCIYNAKQKDGIPRKLYSLSWSLKYFSKHRDRWYDHNGRKRLPKDVSNSPAFWRWFYAGDGCLEKTGVFSRQVTLCVNDFSLEDVVRLQAMLAEHGLVSRKWIMRNQGSVEKPQFLIWLFSENARKFLEMTSPSVRGVEYKWDIPDLPDYTCAICGLKFKPKAVHHRCCSSKCSKILEKNRKKKNKK